MPDHRGLDQQLADWARGEERRLAVAATVQALVRACVRISDIVARGPLAGPLGQATGIKSGCDDQKTFDLIANDEIVAALRSAPVAALASEELRRPLWLSAVAPLLVAVDPIDGSSNIDANISIGTIFSVLPSSGANEDDSQFLQRGSDQLAAGFVVYGPFTSLALTLGEGTDVYTLDPSTKRFSLTASRIAIPRFTAEYAINASNYRHWDDRVRTWLADCSRGRDGPRGKDYNMRWTASPVADIFRILTRGGIFLYPSDQRPGYRQGRLRLVYEANPLSLIVEQAGGAASTGSERILDLVPDALHQHVPLIAGSRDEVAHVVGLYGRAHDMGESSPLFRPRGLFRK